MPTGRRPRRWTARSRTSTRPDPDQAAEVLGHAAELFLATGRLDDSLAASTEALTLLRSGVESADLAVGLAHHARILWLMARGEESRGGRRRVGRDRHPPPGLLRGGTGPGHRSRVVHARPRDPAVARHRSASDRTGPRTRGRRRVDARPERRRFGQLVHRPGRGRAPPGGVPADGSPPPRRRRSRGGAGQPRLGRRRDPALRRGPPLARGESGVLQRPRPRPQPATTPRAGSPGSRWSRASGTVPPRSRRRSPSTPTPSRGSAPRPSSPRSGCGVGRAAARQPSTRRGRWPEPPVICSGCGRWPQGARKLPGVPAGAISSPAW